MSTYDYSRAKATADRLIARYGQRGYLRRPTSAGTDYNPTVGEPVDHPAIFAVLKYDVREVDGTRILATDKKVLLARGNLTIEPATTDRLVGANGTSYSIVHSEPFEPGETTVFYWIQARR